MAHTLAIPAASSLSLALNGGPKASSVSRVHFLPISNPTKYRPLTITCARVGGVEIPNEKRIEFSLQYIHGIGRTRARQILWNVNIENKLTQDLTEQELIALRKELTNYMIEGDLRRHTAYCIKRLKDIQCYRGIRHIQGLPCRGQRTKNNCRTLKGKRMTIPGKKKATK